MKLEAFPIRHWAQARLENVMASSTGKTYIVEHLDEELGPWSQLEYLAIARETQAAGGQFYLSSLPQSFSVPVDLGKIPAFKAEHRDVETIFADQKAKVCLLDPKAAKDLAPADGDQFDYFLFGGILGDDPPRGLPIVLRGQAWKKMSDMVQIELRTVG
jgi:ribosome biogenesis SPOUT family RNA methylase Rps3